MKNLRIIVFAACCVLAPRAWAGAGLTSAGVDPTVGNNNAPAEPTLAQVAPVTNQPGGGSAGTTAGIVPVAGAGGAAQTGAAGQHAAGGAAGDASKSATAVVVAPTPPPPPPDPSTLPVSVIRPLNKAPESAPPPAAESTPTVASKTKPTRQPLASAPTEPIAARPSPRVVQPAPARADTTRGAADAPATPAAATSATADDSANGYVFYTGVGIAGIILALSFAGFMRAGNSDAGPPRV